MGTHRCGFWIERSRLFPLQALLSAAYSIPVWKWARKKWRYAIPARTLSLRALVNYYQFFKKKQQLIRRHYKTIQVGFAEALAINLL